MTARRPVPGEGELSTYQRFRDRLLLGLAAVVVMLMGFFVRQLAADNEAQRAAITMEISAVRGEIMEVRNRLTADQVASSGQTAAVAAQGAEALRRLDGIDKKLDAMTAARR